MEIDPKVSVIIPVYNSEQFLVSTLNSVVSQTLSELEIICVNDCSTDRSAEILSSFASRDKRIIVCTNAENVGAALSRNKGLERATGKYVTFMDSDDRLEPAMYEVLYREASRGGYDVVKCDTFIHAAGKVTTPVYKLELTGKELRDQLIALLLYQFKEDDLPTSLWLSGVWNKFIEESSFAKIISSFYRKESSPVRIFCLIFLYCSKPIKYMLLTNLFIITIIIPDLWEPPISVNVIRIR